MAVAGECKVRGARRTPRPGDPSRMVLTHNAVDRGSFGRPSERRCPSPPRSRGSHRVVRLCARATGGASKRNHRGRYGASLETPRAGRRRVGGLAVTSKPDGASSKSIVPPNRRERIRPVGPSRTRRPARPSSQGVRSFSQLGRRTRRENAYGRMKIESRSRAMGAKECHPFLSHTQARITQARPPWRWHCSLAMFWACTSVAACAHA